MDISLLPDYLNIRNRLGEHKVNIRNRLCEISANYVLKQEKKLLYRGQECSKFSGNYPKQIETECDLF